MPRIRLNIVLLVLLGLGFVTSLYASTVGTISGKVTDMQGNNIPMAEITLSGTRLGALSNANGYYSIQGVPAGNYTVTASRSGYADAKRSGVVVYADLRTDCNFVLTVEASQKYTITAEGEKQYSKYETATKHSFDAQKIARQGKDDFRKVMKESTGLVEASGGGSFSGGLHVRGGRSTEITYIIDGVPVTNMLVGGTGMLVNTNAIEQLNMYVGSFEAQYGDAQSAVVNIVTKEGGESISANASYQHEVYMDTRTWDSVKRLESTGQADPTLPLVTWETRTRKSDYWRGAASIGGPLVSKDLRYFFSGDYISDSNKAALPKPRIEINGGGKLSYQFANGSKVSASANYNTIDRYPFDLQWQYILLEHYLHSVTQSYRTSLSYDQPVGQSGFLQAVLGRFDELRILNVNDQYWSDYNCVQQYGDPTGWFYTDGDYGIWTNRRQYYDGLKLDYQNEIIPKNIAKFGVDSKFYHLTFNSKQMTGYPVSVDYSDDYDVKPYLLSAYVQDKFDYESLVLALGARFDYLNPNVNYVINPFDYQGKIPTSPYPTWEDSPKKQADAKYQVSPRLGISFPITANDKLHFAYGWFFQAPPFQYLYMSRFLPPVGFYPLMGNPDVKPERTIQYEMGVQHFFDEAGNINADANLFFKDIKDLIDTKRVNVPGGYGNYTYVVNTDFGTARGLELTFNAAQGMFSSTLAYTYSIARGLASSFRQGYDYAYYGWTLPKKENLLDWDQTHTLNFNVDIRTDQWGVFNELSYGSGYPYTPPRTSGSQPVVNDERMPWTMTWNARLNYDMKFAGLTTSIFADVLNVLNKWNVLNLGANAGDGAGEDWTTWLFLYDDPDGPFDDVDVYGDPRSIRLGVSVGF
jgi:hypothetical protein